MCSLIDFKKSKEEFVSICAPMVRYSKLPFRLLVREYGCDLAYSPMIMANSFTKSEKARNSEFSSCITDRPLIVQFASHSDIEFTTAAQLVANVSDGSDINCGCPQRWAIQEGIGCAMLKKPEQIFDMVRYAKLRLPSDYAISTKIRIFNDDENGIKRTVELLDKLESIGVNWVGIHARTPAMRSEPAMWSELADIVSLTKLSNDNIILNGDIYNLEDAREAYNLTKCRGIMSARGILNNPALFHSDQTAHINWDCAYRFLELCSIHGTGQFAQIKQHIYWMLENQLGKADRVVLHAIGSIAGLIQFVKMRTLN